MQHTALESSHTIAGRNDFYDLCIAVIQCGLWSIGKTRTEELQVAATVTL